MIPITLYVPVTRFHPGRGVSEPMLQCPHCGEAYYPPPPARCPHCAAVRAATPDEARVQNTLRMLCGQSFTSGQPE